MAISDISWLKMNTELTSEVIRKFNDGPGFPIKSFSKKGNYIISTSEIKNGGRYDIEISDFANGKEGKLIKYLATTRKEEAISAHYSALDLLE